jgi:hypothetical protein
MYLDESGHSRLDNPRIREQSNFFVLGGLIVKEEFYQEINDRFIEFKKINFPKEITSLPIHAVDLNNVSRSSKNPFKNKISDKQGKDLLASSYDFISKLPIEAIVIIIDIHNLKEKYKNPDNPYWLAYEFIIEKFDKIVVGRKEKQNQFGVVNIAECSNKLSTNLLKIHERVMKNGTDYVKDFTNIFSQLNIESVSNNSLYEIADLICYAYQRAYYVWLCQNLGRTCIDEGYLGKIKDICTLKIGKILLDEVNVKVFPEPRFLKK